jgi:3-dehydroquinate dehydratase-1
MICTVLAHKSFEECRDILSREACVELRLDLLDLTQEQVGDLFSMASRTVATCRPGHFSDEERRILLETAVMSGASYLDIELEMPSALRHNLIKLAEAHQCRIIISYHNHKITPPLPELNRIIGKCRKAGADIVKIACKINRQRDLANLLSLYAGGHELIAIGMGEGGLISRLAAPLLGAEFTYASADDDNATAPGQMKSDDMKMFYKQYGINPLCD